MGTLSCLILNLLLTSPVSPGVFGQVFQGNKASVLLVKTSDSNELFTTGFVVGARGEVLFGLAGRKKPTQISVKTSTGAWLKAQVLATNPKLGLGLARLQGSRPGRFAPLGIGASEVLRPENWLVVLAHDKEKQESEPFAGTLRARVRKKGQALQLELDIPGDRGSPVLTTGGKWVGVVHRPGRRNSTAWTVETVVQFLRGVALDQ